MRHTRPIHEILVSFVKKEICSQGYLACTIEDSTSVQANVFPSQKPESNLRLICEIERILRRRKLEYPVFLGEV